MPRKTDSEKKSTSRSGKTTRKRTTTSRKRAMSTKKTTRKAPTRRAHSAAKPPVDGKTLVAVLVAVVFVGGTAAFIGTSDSGQIDVASTVNQKATALEANGDLEAGEAVRSVSTTPPPANNLPNGGLVGRGNKDTEQQKINQQSSTPPPATASSSATSTEATATNTSEEVEPESGVEESIVEDAPVSEGNTEEMKEESVDEDAGE